MHHPTTHAPGGTLIAAAVLALLSGCTALAPDGGFGAVAAAARERIGAEPRLARAPEDARQLESAVQELLAHPLDMDGAVRVALINNPLLQATYREVGIAQADLAQAGRLQNPALDFKHTAAGGGLEIERMLTFNLIGALVTPLAHKLEARRFEQVRREVSARIEGQALDTRRAWVDAVAAAQSLDYARRVDQAAAASADLAERITKAGSMNQLDLARAQVFRAESSAELARAGRRAVAAREQLTRLLGLTGRDAQYTLPPHLPELPAAPAQLEDVERLALEQRLDVQAAKLDAEALAANLGLTRVTRFVNVLDLSAVNKTTTGLPTAHGYELNISLPLFDWGDARVAKAEGQYMQALDRVRDAAVAAQSEARAGYHDYRATYEVARHYRDTVIPLKKRISKEVLLRYNAMQVGPQDLLADSRDQSAAVAAYIEAQREFWNAHVALEGALGMRVQRGNGKEAAE
jgi:outer membrane protein TolC